MLAKGKQLTIKTSRRIIGGLFFSYHGGTEGQRKLFIHGKFDFY